METQALLALQVNEVARLRKELVGEQDLLVAKALELGIRRAAERLRTIFRRIVSLA